MHYDNYNLHCVALRKESVDRNPPVDTSSVNVSVALRKESVDRNTNFHLASLFDLPVALRKESVDRNMLCLLFRVAVGVALRKESVDRNCRNRFCPTCQWRSLSARRAWIEIGRAL